MAGSLDDCEFWLPPQFLTDDDIFMEKGTGMKGGRDGFRTENDGSKGFMPYEFSCGFGSYGSASDLSSPVESVVGSTETESDEEDFLAGWTRQMAHSSLEDAPRGINTGFAPENTKAWVMAGSPQSTLCAVGSGCGCRQGSSRGSPNGPSRVSSPPATWDLLYAAAGEVARMRMNEEAFAIHQSRGLLAPPRKPSPVSVAIKNPTIEQGFYSNQSISHHQFQATQLQQMRHQQLMKQQSQTSWGGQLKTTSPYQQHQPQQMVIQNKARNGETIANRSSRQLGLSLSSWPPLQQQQQQQQQQTNGSGMRAVFLGTPASRRECAGTGVFLPRRVGYPPEPRKKPACSTVLLPARVVQALNLNVDEMGSAQPQIQPRFNGNLTSDTDSAQRLRSNNNTLLSQQKRNIRSQPVMNHEIRLPQEWTY